MQTKTFVGRDNTGDDRCVVQDTRDKRIRTCSADSEWKLTWAESPWGGKLTIDLMWCLTSSTSATERNVLSESVHKVNIQKHPATGASTLHWNHWQGLSLSSQITKGWLNKTSHTLLVVCSHAGSFGLFAQDLRYASDISAITDRSESRIFLHQRGPRTRPQVSIRPSPVCRECHIYCPPLSPHAGE